LLLIKHKIFMLISITRAEEDSKLALHEAADRAVHDAASMMGVGESFTIQKDAWGKPYGLWGEGSIPVSLSHSFPYALGAATPDADCLIGADVERIRFFLPHMSDAFLTDKERVLIDQAPGETKAALTTLAWSLKESVLKALGLGLRMHPRDVDISEALNEEGEGLITVKVQGQSLSGEYKTQKIEHTHVASAIVLPAEGGMLDVLRVKYDHGSSLCHHLNNSGNIASPTGVNN
jgi:phosphopantetheinyl transferase